MMSKMLRLTLLFIAACTHFSGVSAQNTTKAACPPAHALKAEQLHGLWAVRFTTPPAGLPARATMRLERHAEFTESLAGTVSRELRGSKDAPAAAGHAAKAALAGDLEDGLLLLDESSDNISITGTWNGEAVEGSCGRMFRGTWKDTSSSAPANAPDVPFTLTRLP
jgi:hypothetical protein